MLSPIPVKFPYKNFSNYLAHKVMKKKRSESYPYTCKKFIKLLRIMKLVIFFLCVSFTHLSARVYAQQALVNLKVENTSLMQILQEVEKQLKQDFFFSKEEIDVKQKLSVNLTKATLEKS